MKHIRLVISLLFVLCGVTLPAIAQQKWVYRGEVAHTLNLIGKATITITERQYGSDMRYEVSGDYRTENSSCTIKGTYFPGGGKIIARCENAIGRMPGEVTGRLIDEDSREAIRLKIDKRELTVRRVGPGPALPASLTGLFRIGQTSADGKVQYFGNLELRQTGEELTGRVLWDNHMSGEISGIVRGKVIRFKILYEGGLVGTYHGEISGLDMLENGSAVSNKSGGTVHWFAFRLKTVE